VNNLVGDLLLIAIVVALGGWGFSSWKAARRGRIDVPRCPACGRLVSRAEVACRRCGQRLPD